MPETRHPSPRSRTKISEQRLRPPTSHPRRWPSYRQKRNRVSSLSRAPKPIQRRWRLCKTWAPTPAFRVPVLFSRPIKRTETSITISALQTVPPQNNIEGETSLNWVHGRHTLTAGVSLDFTQLNVVNKNNEVARIPFFDFPGFLQGQICGPNTVFCSGQDTSEILNGASNRYYRAKQVGAFVQDDFKIRKDLSVNIGLRWDWDGPLDEKNGFLTNFYANDYSYNVASDTINNIGLVVAGNNRTFGT